MITYELLKYLSITDGNVADINLLLPQLTATPKLLTTSAIQAIALHSRMLTARDESMSIKGMGILSIIHKPTGTEGFINDVVVDAAFCGRGIATALMMRLIALAREYDAEKIELTSNPNRTAANHLYQTLGFELRETNHYRMIL
jgi:ribosomal protein S18 acetylase RimI-like enzyme